MTSADGLAGTGNMASSEQAEQPGQTGSSPATENGVSREALIATAVKFLQNPRVRQSPLATRRAFLKKKGLTDEEIESAFQQLGTAKDEPQPQSLSTQLVPAQPPHLAPYSPPGSRWRDYGALAIIMAGIAFGFHQLYKKYLLPLIMGGKEDRKQLQRIESNISEMSGSVTQTVTQLQTTIASVQELLVQQQQKIQELTQELAASKRNKKATGPCPKDLAIKTSTTEAEENDGNQGLGEPERWLPDPRCLEVSASTSTNWILESQNINELKSEIYSLKGLLLNRRQFPPSPSAPKIPSWQIPVKPSSPSNPVATNHNTSSDISPVSNESNSSSPVKENHSPEGSKVGCHLLGPEEEGEVVIDVKGQVRMEVQGEEEKREDKGSKEEEAEEEEDDEEDDVSHVDEEEECLDVQTEDRRGGDGQINEQVEKLRRPEGASNENEID